MYVKNTHIDILLEERDHQQLVGSDVNTMELRYRGRKRTAIMPIVKFMVIFACLTPVSGTPWSKPDETVGGRVKSLVMPGMLSFADPCYDEDDHARRCVPDFVNAAFGRPVHATSTCGDPPSRLPASLSGCLTRTASHGSAVSTLLLLVHFAECIHYAYSRATGATHGGRGTCPRIFELGDII